MGGYCLRRLCFQLAEYLLVLHKRECDNISDQKDLILVIEKGLQGCDNLNPYPYYEKIKACKVTKPHSNLLRKFHNRLVSKYNSLIKRYQDGHSIPDQY